MMEGIHLLLLSIEKIFKGIALCGYINIILALANKPKIVLADEPTGNLDTNTGNDVLQILLDGIKKYGQTLVMITNNEKIAELADRIVYIENGEIKRTAP